MTHDLAVSHNGSNRIKKKNQRDFDRWLSGLFDISLLTSQLVYLSLSPPQQVPAITQLCCVVVVAVVSDAVSSLQI